MIQAYQQRHPLWAPILSAFTSLGQRPPSLSPDWGFSGCTVPCLCCEFPSKANCLNKPTLLSPWRLYTVQLPAALSTAQHIFKGESTADKNTLKTTEESIYMLISLPEITSTPARALAGNPSFKPPRVHNSC